MRAPLILNPIVPVLHNVVTGNLTFAELRQVLHYLILGLVTLATLPEAQRPLGIDRCLACQRAITTDDLVGILSCDEIIVHILGHLAPNRQHILVFVLRSYAQSTIRNVTVGLPFYAKLHAFVLGQALAELIGIGVPCRTPALSHHLLAFYIYLNIACIVENEIIHGFAGSLDEALIDHRCTIQTNTFRQVLDTTGLGAVGNLRGSRTVELIIYGVLVTHQPFAVLIRIGTRQVTFPTLLVVELEGPIQLQVFLGITPAAVAVRVPQQTIVLARQHERHANLRVILEQVFVQTVHIQLLRLVLAQTIEGLISRISRTVEQQAPRQSITLFLRHLGHIDTNLTIGHTERLEGLAVLSLFQQLFAVGIKKSNASCSFLDTSLYVLCLHRHHVAVGHRKLGLGSLLDHYQALFFWQLGLGSSLYANNIVVDHL